MVDCSKIHRIIMIFSFYFSSQAAPHKHSYVQKMFDMCEICVLGSQNKKCKKKTSKIECI